MTLEAAPTRKPDRRTEASDLRVELWARSEEERTYVHRTRDGFVRIVRCLEGGLVHEAHQIAASGLSMADRRMRQIGGDDPSAA